MYGWRARIGFISPSLTLETPCYEFYRMAPPGVIMVGTFLGIRLLAEDDIKRALEALDRAAEVYSKERVDIVVLGGSPPVVVGGIGSEKGLIQRMERASGTQATTSQTGAIAALKALRVTQVAVATPFDEQMNEKLKQYIEASGLRVAAIEGLGVPLQKMAFLPNEESYKLSREVVRRAENKADGIYIPCAQWPTVETIGVLERDTKLPVVTSLQGMLWYCLRKLGISDKVEGFGRLFEIGTV